MTILNFTPYESKALCRAWRLFKLS